MPHPQSPHRVQGVLPGMIALEPRPSSRPGHKPDKKEAREQKALFDWRDLILRTIPEEHGERAALRWMHMIPNGAFVAVGTAGQLKAMGLTKGVWDVFLPYWSGDWGGLYIEMKAGRNGLSEDQKSFQTALSLGYRFVVARSWIDAAGAICDYLELPERHPAREAAQ